MKAVTWHGKRDVRVDEVPDPKIEEPTDAIVRITSTGDLRLRPAPLRGARHRSSTRATSSATSRWASSRRSAPRSRTSAAGDRVVIPFNISCGALLDVRPGAASRSARRPRSASTDKGAALFGYTKLYGQVPGGQAEYLRVPQAHFGPIKVPEGPPDDRFVYLSDVLPTAWQAVEYAAIPEGGSVAVLGLGPIGQMCCRGSPTTAAPDR